MTLNLVKAGVDSPATLGALRDAIGDYAKDIRLNLSSVLTPEGAPELSQAQIHLVALASAYATRNQTVIAVIEQESSASIDAAARQAAKAAASIMAMNNVYYRYVHLSNDEDIKKMPAKLRMNVIGNPGISKVDFELMSLAVSAINGCGMCIEAHNHELIKAGTGKLALHSAVRIAAVVNAASQALEIAVTT
jgi:alkyl hydroperoxide reductase subunit D